MPDTPIGPESPPLAPETLAGQIECPECGECFSPRGIAAHRRMRHGLGPNVATEMAATLARIAEVLERLESKLEGSNERSAPPDGDGDPEILAREPSTEPPPALPSSLDRRSSELRVLERGLREVLGEIARVKEETDRQLAAWGGRAATEEQKTLEQTSFHTLGSLRRRQASLLFRMQEARGEDAIDNALCM